MQIKKIHENPVSIGYIYKHFDLECSKIQLPLLSKNTTLVVFFARKVDLIYRNYLRKAENIFLKR
jgi:hypothetical protein